MAIIRASAAIITPMVNECAVWRAGMAALEEGDTKILATRDLVLLLLLPLMLTLALLPLLPLLLLLLWLDIGDADACNLLIGGDLAWE